MNFQQRKAQRIADQKAGYTYEVRVDGATIATFSDKGRAMQFAYKPINCLGDTLATRESAPGQAQAQVVRKSGTGRERVFSFSDAGSIAWDYSGTKSLKETLDTLANC